MHLQDTRESQQVKRRTVPYAALDPAHVAATDPSSIREGFLRNASLLSQLADSIPEFFQRRMFSGLAGLPGHTTDAPVARPFGPRPIGCNVWN